MRLPQGEGLTSLVSQPDGKLLALGWRGGSFAIRRLTWKGKPDPSFNGGRPVYFGLDDYRRMSLADALILPDGRILAGGAAVTELEGDDSPQDYGVMVRYTALGEPAEFAGLDGGGWYYRNGVVEELARDPGGQSFTVFDLALAYRYSFEGDPDTTFGDNGRVRLDIPKSFYPISTAAPDGRIVTGGLDRGKRGGRRGYEFRFGLSAHDGSQVTTFGRRGTKVVKVGPSVKGKLGVRYSTAGVVATDRVAIASGTLELGGRTYVGVGRVKLG